MKDEDIEILDLNEEICPRKKVLIDKKGNNSKKSKITISEEAINELKNKKEINKHLIYSSLYWFLWISNISLLSCFS